MAQAGATLRYRMEGLAAFGLVEVVTKIRAHYRLLRALRKDFRAGRYDLVILIDYPGFHLRVAEAAHRAGTKVLYYIAPQLWAWRPGRARRLAAAVDRLAVVLPFEQTFFGGLGLPQRVRGPSAGGPRPRPGPRCGPRAARHRRRQPGARHLSGEPSAGDPPAVGAVPRRGVELLARGQLRPGAGGREPDGASIPIPGRSRSLRGDPARLFAAADAALAKSGTTTLEAALADTPMVVAYKVHPLTLGMFQRVRTVQWVSLVNLVADREVVPELLQDQADAEALAEALRPLLDPERSRHPGPAGGPRAGAGAPG